MVTLRECSRDSFPVERESLQLLMRCVTHGYIPSS
jgi:hypothetical protein